MSGEMPIPSEGTEQIKTEVTEQDVEKAKEEMNKAYGEMLDKKSALDTLMNEDTEIFNSIRQSGIEETNSEDIKRLRELDSQIDEAISELEKSREKFSGFEAKFFELDTEFRNK